MAITGVWSNGMWKIFTINEKGVYYCEECNKIHYSCYELEGVSMCPRCWSDIKFIPEKQIKSFIRYKRLEKLNSVSNE